MKDSKGMAGLAALAAAAFLGAAVFAGLLRGETRTMTIETTDKTGADHPEKVEAATFAAGCFWGVEAAFRKLDGVVETAVGYTGGHTENPTYKEVCSGTTGHAEVVQVKFDPEVITHDRLLETFFALHDPTQVNRQGPDVGYQYRSAIFFHSPEQMAAANAAIENLKKPGIHDSPVATAVETAPAFWRAEDYHQQYLEKRGLASCHINLK